MAPAATARGDAHERPPAQAEALGGTASIDADLDAPRATDQRAGLLRRHVEYVATRGSVAPARWTARTASRRGRRQRELGGRSPRMRFRSGRPSSPAPASRQTTGAWRQEGRAAAGRRASVRDPRWASRSPDAPPGARRRPVRGTSLTRPPAARRGRRSPTARPRDGGRGRARTRRCRPDEKPSLRASRDAPTEDPTPGSTTTTKAVSTGKR